MNLVSRINKYFRDKKEKKFWDWPDEWIAAIILQGDKQVVGKIKKGLGLIEIIPDPLTGYHIADIVEIDGPIGKQLWRDEDINVYKVKRIHKKSTLQLFVFQAIFPLSKDWFYLFDEFKKCHQHVMYPWTSGDDHFEWRQGICTAESIDHAREILTVFCAKNSRRKLGLIEDEPTYLERKNREGNSSDLSEKL